MRLFAASRSPPALVLGALHSPGTFLLSWQARHTVCTGQQEHRQGYCKSCTEGWGAQQRQAVHGGRRVYVVEPVAELCAQLRQRVKVGRLRDPAREQAVLVLGAPPRSALYASTATSPGKLRATSLLSQNTRLARAKSSARPVQQGTGQRNVRLMRLSKS